MANCRVARRIGLFCRRSRAKDLVSSRRARTQPRQKPGLQILCNGNPVLVMPGMQDAYMRCAQRYPFDQPALPEWVVVEGILERVCLSHVIHLEGVGLIVRQIGSRQRSACT